MSEDKDGAATSIWQSDPISHIKLTQKDQSTLTMGGCLDDIHNNLAQEVLRKQFKNLSGLRSVHITVDQAEGATTCYWCYASSSLQGNHWIVAATVGCSAGEVMVFDSLHSFMDEATLNLLKQLFGVHIKVKLERCPQQVGSRDCGLFAIANCTAFAFGSHPAMPVLIKMPCDRTSSTV